jgi:cupin fold WbuC family metalloprotein
MIYAVKKYGGDMKEPFVKDLFRHVDDRGMLDMVFNYDLDFVVKRMYITVNPNSCIRGMHGHKNEWKAFYVISGSIKIITANMDTDEIKSFVLSDAKPQIFVLPPNYYHGYITLSPESRIVVVSNATLDETKKDDYRKSIDAYIEHFNIEFR